MDEWQVEMAEIRRRLHELDKQRGDPVIIDELEAQLRILEAFYATAWRVFEAGAEDIALRREFRELGWGDWTYQNVYSYIYERAMEIEPGRRELSSLIPEMDYAGMIHAGQA
ncbi:MAG TPA: hypothetical protein VG245_10915 [Candidatus Dormibacteraeota bacterium]|nr:hypothetical protein [Candidatus Dormibacteraeota bacterium]